MTLLWIGIAGIAVGVAYTAPPLKLVYRGLGEIAVALGFGPIMLLGAYVVQTGALTWEPSCSRWCPGILVALILYVNEIPDRRATPQPASGRCRCASSPTTVRTGYLVAALAAFGVIVAGVVGRAPAVADAARAGRGAARASRPAGLKVHYDSPYTLMAVMGANVNLNLVVGGLLLVGYVATIVVRCWPAEARLSARRRRAPRPDPAPRSGEQEGGVRRARSARRAPARFLGPCRRRRPGPLVQLPPIVTGAGATPPSSARGWAVSRLPFGPRRTSRRAPPGSARSRSFGRSGRRRRRAPARRDRAGPTSDVDLGASAGRSGSRPRDADEQRDRRGAPAGSTSGHQRDAHRLR